MEIAITGRANGPAPYTDIRPPAPPQPAEAAPALTARPVGASEAPVAVADRPTRPPSDTVAVQLAIDHASHAIVIQSVDEDTGEVVRQIPDQALLRRRAYLIELDERRASGIEATVVGPPPRRTEVEA
ncbi:MAG: flagellar protein FlaG [Methylobacteriaceae bacterium]|nr:flagellar protein FlaG [Methylobacteriaceae bacterium]